MIITCPNCHTKNRVDLSKAQQEQPFCGKCHTPLPIPSTTFDTAHPLTVTDSTFQQTLESSPVPILVDCWAPWCGPCRAIAPVLDQLASESAGRYLIAKLNTDENPATAGAFRINAIPTLLIFKDAKLVDRLEGVHPKPSIQSHLQRHL